MIPEVQTELKLTEAQKNSVREIMEKNRPPRGEGGGPGRGQGRGPGGPPGGGEGQGRELVEKIHKDLKAALTAGQFDRLLQLELQAEGPMAVTRPDIAEKLGLSESQIDQIRKVMEENRPPRPEPGSPPPSRESMDKHRKEVESKVLGVLTASQKSQWTQMKGAPFTFPAPQRRDG